MTLTGLIFDIQRFSVHDGPGIRTTVFFKGCSLRCFWCHNPEGLQSRFQIQFQESRCIHCGACVEACPEQAQGLVDDLRTYERSLCQVCGACVDVCYADALLKVGREVTVEEVMAEVLADCAFYDVSGGGITLSGGEPALQAAFARSLLRASKIAGVHTAIETAGNVPWKTFQSLLPFTDLVMMDLKLMDSARHRQAAGVANERILENACKINASGKPIIFRTPVVPTVNDTPEDIEGIAAFIHALSQQRRTSGNHSEEITWELLAFHRLASDKYHSLGLEYRASELPAPGKDVMSRLAVAAQLAGVPVRIPV